MNSIDINFLAVLVAALLNYILGAAWYSPVMFARPWMRLLDIEPSGDRSGFGAALAVQAVGTLASAFTLAIVISWAGASNLVEGAAVGALAALGFVAAANLALIAFERRPAQLYAINHGYTVVGWILMGAVLGAWN